MLKWRMSDKVRWDCFNKLSIEMVSRGIIFTFFCILTPKFFPSKKVFYVFFFFSSVRKFSCFSVYFFYNKNFIQVSLFNISIFRIQKQMNCFFHFNDTFQAVETIFLKGWVLKNEVKKMEFKKKNQTEIRPYFHFLNKVVGLLFYYIFDGKIQFYLLSKIIFQWLKVASQSDWG